MGRSTQKDRIFLNMAGEFAVASELNRRHVLASVTYGASKAADIFALSERMQRVVRIEVKTTDKKQWPLGKHIITSSQPPDVFWVLVYLPPPNQPPKFFVFSAQEIHEIWRKNTSEFERRYEDKHGHKYDQSLGVPNVKFDDLVLPYEGQWDKIKDRLLES
jgi:hypothetical protein